jgi:SAM-dependent methyltransferase
VKDFKPELSFGPNVAEVYDDVQHYSKTPSRRDRDAAVGLLESLARGGPALELAIGTGWIALPLAARGIRVDGIELSAAMVERLRAKPGGEEMSVTIGDMADVAVADSYRLIFVVANSLFNLLTQDDQVRCFGNVAAHLEDDGVFVIEVFRPDFLFRLRDNQYVAAEGIEVNEVRLDVARHDPVAQLLYESHVLLTGDQVRMNPIVTRYAWPSELDLMARIAGLRPKERWGGWKGEPFTAESEYLVAVYGR